MTDNVQFLSALDCAARLSVSRTTFYKLVAEGVLPPPYKLGRSARWNVEDVDRAVLGSREPKPVARVRKRRRAVACSELRA